MKTQTVLLAVLAAILGGLVARELWPNTETVIRQGPTVTDTLYVDRLEVDTIIEVREIVTSDTVRIPYTVILSDPQTYDCPNLPRIRGITRVAAGQGFDDTTKVSVVDVWADGRQIAVQQSVEKWWTPGSITYLEASDPLRVDFEPWPDAEDTCGFGCKLLWYAVGVGSGMVVWELAR